MNVILLEKVGGLGNLGDQVAVKSGFGRNFLIPTGKAVSATTSNVADFEARRAELEKAAAEKLASAETRKTAVEALDAVVITHKVGDEGKLFGSVGTIDIAKAFTAAGAEVSKSEVRLTDGAFRMAGDFEVQLHFHAEVNATAKFSIISED